MSCGKRSLTLHLPVPERSPQYLVVLDANVFIEAYRRYYAFEICPGFWEFLAAYSGRGVFSIDRVRTELLDGDDLSSWVRNAPRQLFVSTIDKQVADAYSDVVGWIRGDQQYREEAKAAFFKGADGWLVAYAIRLPVFVTFECRFLEGPDGLSGAGPGRIS